MFCDSYQPQRNKQILQPRTKPLEEPMDPNEDIELTSKHIELPGYRHAAPSGPWPWVDIQDSFSSSEAYRIDKRRGARIE